MLGRSGIYKYICIWLLFNGDGFYSAKGELRTKPGFQDDTGLVEVMDQYLRIGTEFRVSDKASFVGELRIFENPRKSYG